MSIHENETNICSDLHHSAPKEPQTYRINKQTEIEAFFYEIEVRERISKKMKRFNTIVDIVDTGLIASPVITGGIYIAAFASGVGMPVGAALGRTSLLLFFATIITRKSFKTFTVKQEKHNFIKFLSQSKLDSIANIVSQGMQDGDILPTEFHKVLQEVEKYCKIKTDIRNQAKAKSKTYHKRTARRITRTTKKRRQRRFFTKNCKFFRYPGCQCHLKYESPPP